MFCIQAQNNSYVSFDRLEPVGEMPEYCKQILQKKGFSNTPANDLKLLEEKFIFTLLMKGKLLYGDPVTLYLNQLLDKILTQKPELQKKIQIYALKSDQVNAFSTPMGTIFVNLGLIAHCSNEAELAFIICHELAHYTKSHVEDKLKMDPDKIKDIDDFLKYYSLSRELEINADKFGFLDFYKDLGYSFEVLENMFDMLQYSNIPFGEKKFTRAFFENEYYQFNDSYFPIQINPVTFRENYVDTLSTHPNILHRRLEMRKIVEPFSNSNSQVTAYFKKEFQEAKMLAQFESINQMIIQNNYLYAYYNSCALQDLYPQHPFLKQTEAAALYALYRLKATDSYLVNVEKASNLRGDIYFPAFVLEKMNKKEMAVWSLRTLWKASPTDSPNDYITLIFNDLVKDVVSKIGSLNQFCDYKMADSLMVKQIPDTSTGNKSKYDRYKERVSIPPSRNFKVENYMLADLKQDSKFLDAFALGILAAEKIEVNNYILKLRKKSQEKISILLFQPVVEIEGVSTNDKKSTRENSIFEKDCIKIAHSCGFVSQMISSLVYDSSYSYPIYIRLLELERNINKIIPLAYETRHSDEVSKVLGTPYLNYVTFSKTKAGLGKENIAYNVPFTALSVFLYPTFPLAVLSWLPPKYNSSINFVLYDLQNKKYLYNTMRNFNICDKSEFFQTLYDNYSAARKTIKQ